MTQRVKVLGSLTLRRKRSLAAVAHTCDPSTPAPVVSPEGEAENSLRANGQLAWRTQCMEGTTGEIQSQQGRR